MSIFLTTNFQIIYSENVCVKNETPDFSEWNDLTSQILNPDAITKIETEHKLPKLYNKFEPSIVKTTPSSHIIFDKIIILEFLKAYEGSKKKCAIMTESDKFIECCVEKVYYHTIPPFFALNASDKGQIKLYLSDIRVLILND